MCKTVYLNTLSERAIVMSSTWGMPHSLPSMIKISINQSRTDYTYLFNSTV